MRIRQTLPEELSAGPFTPAQAALVGVTSAQLSHPALTRTTHGGRSVSPIRTPLEQAAGILVALPRDVAVSHESAGHLWHLPLPVSWSPHQLLHVMRDHDRARLRRRGIVYHAGLDLREVDTRLGVRTVSPGDTWCDLAEAFTVDELVVAGDALVRGEAGLLTVDELTTVVQRRSVSPGIVLAREALLLIRVGSKSPMETRARLIFQRGGLPEPELNADITDEWGGWLANCDFVWRKQKVIGEYDGDQHRRDKRRWRQTVARRELLHDEGWRVITMTEPDVHKHAHATLTRFRRALG